MMFPEPDLTDPERDTAPTVIPLRPPTSKSQGKTVDSYDSAKCRGYSV